MQELYRQPVFEVDGETFCWEDVILAARRAGRWAAFEAAAREGLAAMARLEGRDDPGVEEAIEEAANEFRYERDLLRSDDAEAWLAARGVTIDEWMDMIGRQVLRARAGPESGAWISEWVPEPAALAGALRVDLQCAAAGADLVRALAERAAGAAAGNESAGEGGVYEIEDDPEPELVGEVPGLDEARRQAVAERLDRIDHGWARFERALTSPEAIARQIGHRQLDWIGFDCELLGFARPSQALEAALCVREDELSLQQVAADAHKVLDRLRFVLDELEPESRPLFLAAGPGDIVGPIDFQGHHALFHILEKTPPSAHDPEIRRRAADCLVAKAAEGELERRVRWLIAEGQGP